MYKLYRFYWDCHRMGELEGLFIATEEEVQFALGKDIYFGEVLGKHSEISGSLEDGDLEVISEDQEKIGWLKELLGKNVSGRNPLNYVRITCPVCGDDVYEGGCWYDDIVAKDGEYYHIECIENGTVYEQSSN